MKSLALSLLAFAVLSGCASTISPSSSSMAATGRCFASSRIDTSVFEPVDDSALLRSAVRLPDSGGVRCAEVYRLKVGKSASATRVYGGKGWRFGRWWTFGRPGTDSTVYRQSYEICRAWNALDSIATCALKAGTRFAIGPGQSAVCGNDPGYDASDSLQVFFANPQVDLDVTNCRFETMTWGR